MNDIKGPGPGFSLAARLVAPMAPSDAVWIGCALVLSSSQSAAPPISSQFPVPVALGAHGP
jgi:hypothetical protein